MHITQTIVEIFLLQLHVSEIRKIRFFQQLVLNSLQCDYFQEDIAFIKG